MKVGCAPPGFDAGDVADEDLVEAGGEARGEVAHLIGVREDDVGRLDVLDELGAGGGVAVGGVGVQQGMVDRVDIAWGFALDGLQDRVAAVG